jgi:hypothetical protein
MRARSHFYAVCLAMATRYRASMRASSLLPILALACGDAAPDAPVDRSSELRDLVGGLLGQYTREVEATCPCRARDGDFASTDECVAKLGHDPSFADCVTDKISDRDNAELREALACMRERYERRARCLEREGCELNASEACYAAAPECPVLDPQALSRALRECPGGTLLGR